MYNDFFRIAKSARSNPTLLESKLALEVAYSKPWNKKASRRVSMCSLAKSFGIHHALAFTRN